MTDTPPPPLDAPYRRYRIASEEVWAVARTMYLAGMPGPEVARRLDVSEWALRRRATLGGWTRRAHAARVLDVVMPAVGGDRRTLRLPGEARAPGEGAEGFAPASPPPPAEADPEAALEFLVRRAAALALAGEAREANALLRACAGLRREAGVAAGLAPPSGWEEEAPPADAGRAGDGDPLTADTPEARAELEYKLARMAWRIYRDGRGGPSDWSQAELDRRAAQMEQRRAEWEALASAEARPESGAHDA